MRRKNNQDHNIDGHSQLKVKTGPDDQKQLNRVTQ